MFRSRLLPLIFGLLATPALALTLATFTNPFAGSPVVGRMGSTELTVKQINELIKAQTPAVRQSLLTNPESLKEFIRTELLRRSLIEETKKAEWTKRPDVAYVVDRAKEQAIVDHFLATRAEPEATYPTDKEIQAAYEANLAQLQIPEQVHLAQILIRVADNASPEENNRAANLTREIGIKLEKGAEFGAMAALHSQDEGSKGNKGELDWLPESSLSPQLRGEVKNLAVGGVAKPLRTPFGWQILKVLGRKPASTRPLAEVREAIINAMRVANTAENRNRYLESIKKANPPMIDEKTLKTIDVR